MTLNNHRRGTMFYFNRGSLEIGSDWQDKSIILLTNEFGQSISISYDKLPFGMGFSEFCEREVTSLGKQLTDYKEVSRETGELDNRPCVFTEYSWHSPQGKLQQITAIVDMADKFPLMITLTSVVALTSKQKEILLDIVRSFKARVG